LALLLDASLVVLIGLKIRDERNGNSFCNRLTYLG